MTLPTHHDLALAVECLRPWCATDGPLTDPWVVDIHGRRCIAASDGYAGLIREVPPASPLGRCCPPGTRAPADVPKFAQHAGPQSMPADPALLAALTPAVVAARELLALGLRPWRRPTDGMMPVVYMLWTATACRAAVAIHLAKNGPITATPEPRLGESCIIVDARYLAALPGRPIAASCDVADIGSPLIIDIMHPSGEGLHRVVIARVRP
jgi:hypothetical protein